MGNRLHLWDRGELPMSLWEQSLTRSRGVNRGASGRTVRRPDRRWRQPPCRALRWWGLLRLRPASRPPATRPSRRPGRAPSSNLPFEALAPPGRLWLRPFRHSRGRACRDGRASARAPGARRRRAAAGWRPAAGASSSVAPLGPHVGHDDRPPAAWSCRSSSMEIRSATAASCSTGVGAGSRGAAGARGWEAPRRPASTRARCQAAQVQRDPAPVQHHREQHDETGDREQPLAAGDPGEHRQQDQQQRAEAPGPEPGDDPPVARVHAGLARAPAAAPPCAPPARQRRNSSVAGSATAKPAPDERRAERHEGEQQEHLGRSPRRSRGSSRTARRRAPPRSARRRRRRGSRFRPPLPPRRRR